MNNSYYSASIERSDDRAFPFVVTCNSSICSHSCSDSYGGAGGVEGQLGTFGSAYIAPSGKS